MKREALTGVVLAGGLGRRMGGGDKGLRELRGRPLAGWVIDRLAPQVGPILINANRNIERYAAFGHPVVPDAIGGFAGPLAGLHAGLKAAATEFVVTAPCDSPLLPADLVARLSAALEASDARLALARAAGQPHPVFALTHRSMLPDLEAFLAEGGRKVDCWFARFKVVEADFDDETEAFANINTVEELRRLGDEEPRR